MSLEFHWSLSLIKNSCTFLLSRGVIVYYEPREKTVFHTSKINVSPVLHTIFFPLGGQKMNLFTPQRENNTIFDPIV